MKINGKHDIDVPLAIVGQILADFQGWERAAMRRGVEVKRTDTLGGAQVGAKWHGRFNYRGKSRNVELRVLEMDASGRITMSFLGSSMEGTAQITTFAMGAHRSRIAATIDVQARTLAARLLFQSLRLARQRVVRRFERRLAQFGAEIELRYAATRG
jgi:carbon monoxide dehydrogenase subunit G